MNKAGRIAGALLALAVLSLFAGATSTWAAPGAPSTDAFNYFLTADTLAARGSHAISVSHTTFTPASPVRFARDRVDSSVMLLHVDTRDEIPESNLLVLIGLILAGILGVVVAGGVRTLRGF